MQREQPATEGSSAGDAGRSEQQVGSSMEDKKKNMGPWSPPNT
jgi:hypothetical protein